MSTDTDKDLGFELPARASGSRTRVLLVAVLVVAGVFTLGYLSRRTARGSEPVAQTTETTRVEVTKPKIVSSDQALSLPGVVRPLEETKIYPRITGYVRKWNVDIGDKVEEGAVLADIDTPDLDAQLAQAVAQAAQARAAVKQISAQRDYSKSNAARYSTLADQKLVSQGSAEQVQAQAQADEATLAAQQASVAAADANVKRLKDLQGFAKVTAPFAGKITARWVDRGTAVVGDSLQTPMFQLDATDPVRVFVDVPQTVASSLQVGTPAELHLRELGDKTFKGTVARFAGALDPALHTMPTELRVPNGSGELIPGQYVQATITLSVPHKVIEIPATALYSDAAGLRVGVIDAQHHIKLVPITIERDTGATLWVGTGLTGDEQIVKIAVPTLNDGDAVEVGK